MTTSGFPWPKFSADKRTFLYGGVAALILSVIITAGVTVEQLHRQVELRIAVTTQSLANSIEQTFNGLIDTIDVALLASSNEITHLMSLGSTDRETVSRMLAEQKSHIPYIAYLRATDALGDIRFGPDVTSPPVNIADREHFLRLYDNPDNGLAINKPFVGRITEQWVWTFSRPIRHLDGAFGGVVFATVNISEIDKILARIKIDPGNSISLRNPDLSLITRYPVDSVTQFPIGEKRFSQPFIEAIEANPSEGTYQSGPTSIDGIDRTYSYVRNNKYGFVVNVGMSTDRAFAEWRKQARIVSGMSIIFIIVLLLSSRLISRSWRTQEEASASLREAQRIARLGQYDFDLRTRRWTSSDIFDEIYGIDTNYPRDFPHWFDLAAPDAREERWADTEQVITQGMPSDREYRILRQNDGQERWVFSKERLKLDDDGTPQALVGTVQDITERKQAEADLRIAAVAFDSQEAMLITDSRGNILRVNRAFTENTGYTTEEAVGQNPRLLKSSRHDAAFFKEMWECIVCSGRWQGEIWDRRKDGIEYQKWLTISSVKDANGLTTHYIGAQYDISERKKAEEKINELAFFDQLTGLPNRTLLTDRLRQTMSSGSRSDRYSALLFVDLDNFKSLNDTSGHDVGDQLLKQVAERLTQCAREVDSVARLGGDDFVVILSSLSATEAEAATTTEMVAQKMLTALSQVYRLGDLVHHCTASIGVTLFKGLLTSVDELMKQTDLTLYKAKAAGRNSVLFFDPAMAVAVKERSVLEGQLRQAINEKQFLLHYQAQVVEAGRLIGAEVLLRWHHAQRGMVSPAEFIPLAEETGLILPIGEWVLETTCTQLAQWAAQPEMAHLTLAVNVSAKQLRQPNFVDQVLAILQRTCANPQRLKLELTESMLIDNVQEIIEKMSLLKARGVGFSLDDFGTGYSSLTYLKRLPLDQLKIDQSFVRDLLIDANDAAIAKTIVALAQSLGLNVIAEGVETEAQRDALAVAGCHVYQGYYFSRPLPVLDFEAFVVRR